MPVNSELLSTRIHGLLEMLSVRISFICNVQTLNATQACEEVACLKQTKKSGIRITGHGITTGAHDATNTLANKNLADGSLSYVAWRYKQSPSCAWGQQTEPKPEILCMP